MLRAVAGDAVSWPQKARVAAYVHVQQIAGTGPLVAAGRLPDQGQTAREPGPPEHPVLSPTVADPLLQLARKQPRRTPRPARAIHERAQLASTSEPAMPPAMRCRRRHTEGGRGRLQRKPFLDSPHQREPTSQSELGISVQIHPSPPLGVSPARPTASKEGRITPQPFTKSVGRTTRRCGSPAAAAGSRRGTRTRR